MNTEEKAILSALEDGPMSRGDLSRVTGMGKRRVGYRLSLLKDSGLVVKSGDKRTSLWMLASESCVSHLTAMHRQSAVYRYICGRL